jgi:hypothetical protein
MNRRLVASLVVFVALVLALAGGGLGVYADHRGPTTPYIPGTVASYACPAGGTLVQFFAQPLSSSSDPSPTPHFACKVANTTTEGSHLESATSIPERPAVRASYSGMFGRDSAPYWWYGAGAVFLLGLAGAGLILVATRPPAKGDAPG